MNCSQNKYWLKLYLDNFIDAIPLIANSKKPMKNNWQSLGIEDLWLGLGENTNIGIRCGGKRNLVVIDCDDKEISGTSQNIMNWLIGLGYSGGDFPMVKTDSGDGRHYYFRSSLQIPGSYKIINQRFGSGEVRYGKGAYVVAPPSIVNNRYEVLSGNFRNIPNINSNDIYELIGKNNEKYLSNTFELSILPFKAANLLQGKNIEKYASRSEAEYAILQILITEGLEFQDILKIFISYPGPGKFRGKYLIDKNSAIKWLYQSYLNAKRSNRANNNPIIKALKEYEHFALNNIWCGRSGLFDRSVLLGHIAKGKKHGSFEYYASTRDLAILAGVSQQTANNATKRLITKQYLEVNHFSEATESQIYKLTPNFTNTQNKTICICKSFIEHDCFRYQGLGKTGEIIFSLIYDNSLSLETIIEFTKLSPITVKKRLFQMSQSYAGELILIEPLVICIGGLWTVNNQHDLDEYAKFIGTYGKRMFEKKKYFNDRRSFSRFYKRNRGNYEKP
jgi:hypothetical protein